MDMSDYFKHARKLLRKRWDFFKWFAFIFVFLFFSCSSLTGKVMEKPFDLKGPAKQVETLTEAGKILLKLETTNNKLKTFKGLGRIKLWNKGKLQTARVAWIGSRQGKLRFEIFSIPGQPSISLSSDGKYFYVISHAKRRFYKKRSTDASLKKIIFIPVKSIDIIALLAGRVPVHEHNDAAIERNESGEGYVLILNNNRADTIERLYLDDSKTKVYKIEMFDTSGILVYKAIFSRMQNINGYRVPLKLVISNDDVVFSLIIDKYWTDVKVSPSIFVLALPESEPEKDL